MNAFVINLQIGTSHEEPLIICRGINAAKNMREGLRDYPILSGIVLHAHHGMRLPAASLPVRKNSS